jgi:ABC-type transport system involved in cytochrome c biogenesis permease subunit
MGAAVNCLQIRVPIYPRSVCTTGSSAPTDLYVAKTPNARNILSHTAAALVVRWLCAQFVPLVTLFENVLYLP